MDEVDSILVDEARTPLIISEPEVAADIYYTFARIVRGLQGSVEGRREGHRARRRLRVRREAEDGRAVPGRDRAVERSLRIENLYHPQNAQLVNHLIQALKAESLYAKDVEYVIQDGEVKIVDEFAGRIMEGRRWSEGLHQAVEAKEGSGSGRSTSRSPRSRCRTTSVSTRSSPA